LNCCLRQHSTGRSPFNGVADANSTHAVQFNAAEGINSTLPKAPIQQGTFTMKRRSNDQLQKAIALMESGRKAEAKALFAKILRSAPDHVDANYLMGTLCAEDGDFSRGEQLLCKARRMMPQSPYILNNLGNVYQMQAKYDAALECYQKAVEIKPDLAPAHCNMGVICKQSGDFDNARRHFQQAEKLSPGMDKVRAGLASLEERSGDSRKARKQLKRLIDSASADLHTFKAYAEAVLHDDSSKVELQEARTLLANLAEDNGRAGTHLPRVEQAKVGYLLGALHDKLGEYDLAFACFAAANRLSSQRFDIKGHRKTIERIRKEFNVEQLTALPRNDAAGGELIFIVGMPRSGSTLIEQILDSHPDSGSLGECDLFAEALSAVGVRGASQCLSREQAQSVARLYLNAARQREPAARILTDKTLSNYLHIGQIAQTFPQAKVIHCERNAADTCLSCFFHDFAGQYDFTNELGVLGQYFSLYAGLMEHWQEVLPGVCCNVGYETLTGDAKAGIKRLLKCCGLKYNRACLKFYRNKRVVNTASYYQVRKPIYRSSVDRSKAYAEHLAVLLNELRSVERPGGLLNGLAAC
jgi:Flp pilus assembly protein TadD